LDGVVLKLVPEIITVAPTAPLPGLKPVIVGEGRIVKLLVLVIVTPLTVTAIGPEEVPVGTEVVMLVVVAADTTAETPLKVTELFEGVELKFVPVMITVAPIAPDIGEKPVMVGVGNTLKLFALTMVKPLVVTEILPFVAPAGTIVVMLLAVEEVTRAATPLKNTSGVEPKFVPEIITVAPMAALAGLKLLMVGVDNTVKLSTLVTVTPFTSMDIGPVAAPGGTRVSTLDAVAEVMVADTPVKERDGEEMKLEPETFTTVPTAPLVGVKPVITGDGNTIKFELLLIVTPFTVIEIGPVDAPAGTVVDMLPVLDEFTKAGVPLKETEGVVLKFVPVIVMMAPTEPLEGLNPVMVGGDSTTKLLLLRTVTPLTATDIFPDVAPAGTVTVMVVLVEAVTTAEVLLNFTK